jgi:hypothetical protein
MNTYANLNTLMEKHSVEANFMVVLNNKLGKPCQLATGQAPSLLSFV